MRSKAPREQKKCKVNSDLQSEETWRGIPCLENMCVMKASAMSAAVALLVVGIKTLSLERRSITTKIEVKPFDDGSCLIKSILIECHGRSGIGSGCRRLYGRCCKGLLRAHKTH